MANCLPGVPVIVGACRFRAGQVAIEQGADILLLDDGFQHRALYRDVDIVLLDKERPLGNGRLLPGGSLREAPQALRRADIVVMTGTAAPVGQGLSPARQKLLAQVPHLFHAAHKAQAIMDGSGVELPLDFLQGKRVYAFAGIGRPLSFRRTIETLGAVITGFAVFPDHHCYQASELATITGEAAQTRSDIILTTEKDGVRLGGFKEFLEKLFLLRVEMSLIPAEEGLLNVILDKLRITR
jgi:tetraacyldisaccharide 4'-kinase